MENKSFSKTICISLFLAGLVSNTIGLVINSFGGCDSWLDILNLSATAASLILILAPGLFALKNQKYLSYSRYVVLVTAWLSFPIILLTSKDAVFLMYVCLLGPAFGLLATNKNFITLGTITVFVFDAILVLKVIFNIQIDTDYLRNNLPHLLGSLTATYLFSLYATSYSTKKFFELTKNLELKSTTDALTGALNRNSLTTYELKDSGILMIDIDHFKMINDAYGHLNGDKSLQFLVSTLKSHIRKDDRVVRFGGEEFIIIIKNIQSVKQLHTLAEHLRELIEKSSKSSKDLACPFTISIGCHLYRNDLSLDNNIRIVDTAMYNAKKAGRNRVWP